MYKYKTISDFGKGTTPSPVNNPLSYCTDHTMNNLFVHGAIAQTIAGPDGKHCKAFMSERCSQNWDQACENESKNISRHVPNQLEKCGSGPDFLTAGEILVKNTASRKYLVNMLGNQCNVKYEPFDPTVASSPMVSFWDSSKCNTRGTGNCVPVYAVDPKNIDSDPVMTKILNKPIIALSLLINIYNTAKRKNKLEELKGTRIYSFFMSKPFQHYIQESSNRKATVTKGCGC
jgi:hypothetical protein